MSWGSWVLFPSLFSVSPTWSVCVPELTAIGLGSQPMEVENNENPKMQSSSIIVSLFILKSSETSSKSIHLFVLYFHMISGGKFSISRQKPSKSRATRGYVTNQTIGGQKTRWNTAVFFVYLSAHAGPPPHLGKTEGTATVDASEAQEFTAIGPWWSNGLMIDEIWINLDPVEKDCHT